MKEKELNFNKEKNVWVVTEKYHIFWFGISLLFVSLALDYLGFANSGDIGVGFIILGISLMIFFKWEFIDNKLK